MENLTKLLNTDNNARAGLIQTAHGEIETQYLCQLEHLVL